MLDKYDRIFYYTAISIIGFTILVAFAAKKLFKIEVYLVMGSK